MIFLDQGKIYSDFISIQLLVLRLHYLNCSQICIKILICNEYIKLCYHLQHQLLLIKLFNPVDTVCGICIYLIGVSNHWIQKSCGSKGSYNLYQVWSDMLVERCSIGMGSHLTCLRHLIWLSSHMWYCYVHDFATWFDFTYWLYSYCSNYCELI